MKMKVRNGSCISIGFVCETSGEGLLWKRSGRRCCGRSLRVVRWKGSRQSLRDEENGPVGTQPRETEKKEAWKDSQSTIDPSMADGISKTWSKGRGGLPFASELNYWLNHPVFEVSIIVLVLATCVCFAVETLPDLSVEVESLLLRVEAAASSIFLAEYFLRFYSSNLSIRFLLRRIMLIDLAAILPLFFSNDVFQLEFLRLARILRLQRLLQREDFTRLFGRTPEYRLRTAEIVVSIFTILYISSGLVYDAEHETNPEHFGTFFDALYFSVVTLTTTGFGDIVPITPQGKFIVCGSILTGVFLIPYQLSQLAQSIFSRRRPWRRSDAVEVMTCKFQDSYGNWYRLRIDLPGSPGSFASLVDTIAQRLNCDPSSHLTMTYKDEENDDIVVTSDEDLVECARFAQKYDRDVVILNILRW